MEVPLVSTISSDRISGPNFQTYHITEKITTDKNLINFSSINNTLQLVNYSIKLKNFKTLNIRQLKNLLLIALDFIYFNKLFVYIILFMLY